MAVIKPLTLLFNMSLNTGKFPDKLKTAIITAVYKGKDKSEPANYRPVSLTSIAGKIIEKCIRKHLVDHLERNNLLNVNQHGFRSGRSCLTQLLKHYSDMIEAVEDGVNMDSIYLDYAKAFDKVDHGLLVHRKLKDVKVGGKVAKWIESFLKKSPKSPRRQQGQQGAESDQRSASRHGLGTSTFPDSN